MLQEKINSRALLSNAGAKAEKGRENEIHCMSFGKGRSSHHLTASTKEKQERKESVED